jgi:hypothetical protein
MYEQAVRGIRDVLREAFEEISDSDELLKDIGLERRQSRAPYWLATAGLFAGGVALGAYRRQILRSVGLLRAKRRMHGLPIVLLGGAASAGGLSLLLSPQGKQFRRATGEQLRLASRRLFSRGDSEGELATIPPPSSVIDR